MTVIWRVTAVKLPHKLQCTMHISNGIEACMSSTTVASNVIAGSEVKLRKQVKVHKQTHVCKHAYALTATCWTYSTRVLEDTPVDTVARKQSCFHMYTNTPKKETNADAQ